MNWRIINMEVEKMYSEYASYIKRFEKMVETINELIKDRSVEGFQLTTSDRTIETVVFNLKYENREVRGTMTLKEIYVFLEEKNYNDDRIKQGVCDLILKKAKDAFVSKLYEKKP